MWKKKVQNQIVLIAITFELNQLTFQDCVAPVDLKVNLQTPDKRQKTNGKSNCVERILVFH